MAIIKGTKQTTKTVKCWCANAEMHLSLMDDFYQEKLY